MVATGAAGGSSGGEGGEADRVASVIKQCLGSLPPSFNIEAVQLK